MQLSLQEHQRDKEIFRFASLRRKSKRP
jgi:hypothetical protein